jgi:UDP-GlcNAc:undecaprenyl-phosphate GlcNAc-1-phosphate transferase
MGGIAVLVPVLVSALIFSAVLPMSMVMREAFFASAFVLIIGVLDDRLGLSPMWRIVALSFVCFGLFSFNPFFVLHSVTVWGFTIPLDPFAAPITALMVIGLVNAGNMADGINGQLLGSVLIWSAFIVHYLDLRDAAPFVVLMCSTAIALLFNLRDKLFSGSAGSYGISCLIALGSIAAYRAGLHTQAEMPVLWFWLPVLDCLRLIIFRMIEHRRPFSGDRNHIHHLLMDIVRVRYALLIYLVFLGIPGALAEINEHWGKVALITCLLIYSGFVSWRTWARRQAVLVEGFSGRTDSTGELSSASSRLDERWKL